MARSPVSGIGQIKQEGDTNEFVPGSGIFGIKGIDPKEKLAIKVNRSPKNIDPEDAVFEYHIVNRTIPIEQVDKSQIIGSKGDTEEVAAALQNIRKVDPYLYNFESLGKRVQLHLATYASKETTPDTMWEGTYLDYIFPEANTVIGKMSIQGFLEISEYDEKIKKRGNFKTIYKNANTNPEVTDEFVLNGLNWKKHKSSESVSIYVGQKNDRYYEIRLQGKLSNEQMKEVLSHFLPSNK